MTSSEVGVRVRDRDRETVLRSPGFSAPVRDPPPGRPVGMTMERLVVTRDVIDETRVVFVGVVRVGDVRGERVEVGIEERRDEGCEVGREKLDEVGREVCIDVGREVVRDMILVLWRVDVGRVLGPVVGDVIPVLERVDVGV